MSSKSPRRLFGPRKRPPSKRVRAIVAMTVLLLSIVVVLAPSFVDRNHLRDMVSQVVKKATGHPLKVKGTISLRLLPSPTLTLTNVELDVGKNNLAAPHLHAERMMIQFSYAGMLDGHPKVTGVLLDGPLLEIERAHDGEIHWDWMNTASGVGHGLISALRIERGKVAYFNTADETGTAVEDVNLSFAQDPKNGISATGQMNYLGKPMHVRLALPPLTAGKGTRLEMHFWQTEATSLSATLEKGAGGAAGTWHGDLQAQVEDINQWLPSEALPAPQAALPSMIPGAPGAAASAPAPPRPYPVKVSGKLDYTAELLKVTELHVQTNDSSGNGAANIKFGAVPAADVQLAFNQLEVSPALVEQYLAPATAGAEGSLSPVDIAESASRLPKNVNLTFQLGAEKLMFNSQQFSNVTLKASLANGELGINSLSGGFAGGTAITLSGKIADTAKGMRFVGRTETSGHDLRSVLAIIDPAATRLPEKGFNEYYVAANVFISADQLRLSEADFRLGDLHLNGGLVTYFEAKPRVEADIVLSDINLDYFRDTWRESLKQNGSKDFTYRIDSSVDFSWLKNLKPIVDLKLTFKRFTFLDKPGDLASFQLYAKQNEFGIHDIDMRYPNLGELKGNVTVTVNDIIPHIDVDLQIPELNTLYFSEDGKQLSEPWINPAQPEQRWSQKLFDFSWMIGVSANVNLGLSRLIHRGQNFDRVALQGQIAGEQFQVSRLTFEHFGGKIDAKGVLSGGKVPGFSGSLSGYNLDLQQMLSSIAPNDTLSGRVSVSAAATSSGISFEDWVKQADIKLVVAGRGIRVQAFNMLGVSDAVLASRSVADVVANINRTLPVSSTDFAVDGDININGGIVRTPGLSVVAGQAVGTLTGEIRLLSWQMALSTVFQMRMLASNPLPTFTVDVSGTPDKYDTRLDTSSLEAYVAKRIVGD